MVKTKALISFSVTPKLQSATLVFFAYADCWFSHEAAWLFDEPHREITCLNLYIHVSTHHLSRDNQQDWEQLI